MANIMMGMKASIGPPLPTPTRSLPQPYWKIMTTTP